MSWPGCLRVRAVLAPTRDPRVDEARVAREAHVGPEAEALGRAGAVALDEHVGLVDEPERGREPVGVLEVDGHRASTAQDEVDLAPAHDHARGRCFRVRDRAGRWAGQSDDVGPEVGEHHRAERSRAPTFELDDPHPRERSRHRFAPRPSSSARLLAECTLTHPRTTPRSRVVIGSHRHGSRGTPGTGTTVAGGRRTPSDRVGVAGRTRPAATSRRVRRSRGSRC